MSYVCKSIDVEIPYSKNRHCNTASNWMEKMFLRHQFND